MASENIFSQFLKPVRSVAEYSADMDTAEQNKLALTASRMQAQQAQQGMQDDQALRAAYAQAGGDQNKLMQILQSGGQYKAGQALQKSMLDFEKTRADIGGINAKTGMDAAHGKNFEAQTGKTNQEVMHNDYKSYATQVIANPTMENARQAVLKMALKYGSDPTQELVTLAGFQSPDQIKQWAAGHALEAEKLMPKTASVGLGGNMAFTSTNPVTGQVTMTGTQPITQSADNLASGKVTMRGQDITAGTAAAGRAQADRHFSETHGAPQYMQTEAGLVALPKKLAVGEVPTATMISGPGGEPLGKPLKDVPASANTAIISNVNNLQKAQQALALLQGKNIGEMTGDKASTGWKGMLPGAVLNRVDPSGVDTRAAIADLGSMVLHDRSGAAVTASEYPRLQPFIPTATDDAATAAKKLKRFIQVYEQENQALGETYSKAQGYKPNPLTNKPTAKPSGPVKWDDLK